MKSQNAYNYLEDKEYLDYLEREKKEAHMYIYDDWREGYKEEKEEKGAMNDVTNN
jgi:hypothetical protein